MLDAIDRALQFGIPWTGGNPKRVEPAGQRCVSLASLGRGAIPNMNARSGKTATSLASLGRGAIPNGLSIACRNDQFGIPWTGGNPKLDGGRIDLARKVWHPLDGGQSQTPCSLQILTAQVWHPLDGGQSQTEAAGQVALPTHNRIRHQHKPATYPAAFVSNKPPPTTIFPDPKLNQTNQAFILRRNSAGRIVSIPNGFSKSRRSLS